MRAVGMIDGIMEATANVYGKEESVEGVLLYKNEAAGLSKTPTISPVTSVQTKVGCNCSSNENVSNARVLVEGEYFGLRRVSAYTAGAKKLIVKREKYAKLPDGNTRCCGISRLIASLMMARRDANTRDFQRNRPIRWDDLDDCWSI